MYDLHANIGEGNVKVAEYEDVTDLLVVHCTSAEPRSVIPPILVLLLFFASSGVLVPLTTVSPMQ